jgi:L-glyceraldehyde 3-phosphate reductase
VEPHLLDVLKSEGVGAIPFSPLAQGLLSNKYLSGIPENSRAAKESGYLKRDDVSAEKIVKIAALDKIAQKRGQSLAQMAVAWVLRKEIVTSALIGASRVQQIEELVIALDNIVFDESEIKDIDKILNGSN